jgi:hypothetical protein
MWSTGGFALSYLAGTERLAILGRTDSVFAADAPMELQDALELYHNKDFADSEKAAKSVASRASSERVRRLAKQLFEAARRNLNSIELTLQDMEANLARKDLYKLKRQLLGIESVMDADDPRLSDFQDAVEDPANENILSEGAKYYSSVRGTHYSGPRGFELVAPVAQINDSAWSTLKNLAQDEDSPYSVMARDYIKARPEMITDFSETAVLPPEGDDKATCWSYSAEGRASGDKWKMPGFSARGWKATALPAKVVGQQERSQIRGIFEIENPDQVESMSVEYLPTGPFKVFLNGSLVLEWTGRQSWKWETPVRLKPVARELLQSGENCLAIESSSLGHEFDLTFRVGEKGDYR